MTFNLTEQEIFFIIFFILAALVVWACLDIVRFLRRERRALSFPEDFAKGELFLRISEDFRKQLEELIKKEVQKNLEEFKNTLQKTSEEIIKNYKNQFGSGSQEIQRVLSDFFQQISKEASLLSKFTLENQEEFAKEIQNKISELNQVTKKEVSKIQETNLKTQDLLLNETKRGVEALSNELSQKFGQIFQSTRETLNKKVEETKREIENYKKEEFREIDRKIYLMLGEVAKRTMGKAIDLSDHEKLVIEALEKAKKEIF